MKKLALVLGALMVRVVTADASTPLNQGLSSTGNDGTQQVAVRRIEQRLQSSQDFKEDVDGLINDILAVSNRETKVAFLRLFAQKVKAMPSDNLDLRSRYQELRSCHHFTECGCRGFRQIGGHADDIWDLRFALLSRYVDATNNCHTEWERIVKHDERAKRALAAAGKLPFMSSGPTLDWWPVYFARMMDDYLMEVLSRWYRIDTQQLSAEDKNKVKSTIERIVGRGFDLSKPVQLFDRPCEKDTPRPTVPDMKVDLGDL